MRNFLWYNVVIICIFYFKIEMVELNNKNFNKEKNIGFYMNYLYIILRLKVYLI